MPRFFVLLLLVFAFLQNASADVKIGTWNLEHLSVRPNKDFQSIAKVAQNVDFLAVQELMNEDALQALAQALTRQTGKHWSTMASHAVGRSSYKEMYGFVWRDDVVAYEDGAVTYLDRGDTFEREPYSARFKSLKDGSTFVVATVHILYGKNQADRASEITALSSYWAWLKDTYSDNGQIMLMGDFNTPPTSPAWATLDASAKPLVLNGASTLSSKDGKFANLYDNIFISKNSTIKVNNIQVFDYPKYLGLTHVQGRESVSDHAPIFLNASFGANGTVAQAAPVRSALPNPMMPTRPSASAANNLSAAIRGNKKTMVYHRPDCPSYNAVSEKNRIEFISPAAAEAQHYHLAGNCH
ncbi:MULTISPECIES: endonuclease/exonuclease/phosphatase family protein [unclassified Pseudomonas]|uniref:endonuclease/exonuclease/phosphatase family protein n=1 Tax=unclassified Pseudomonas TaxID=196821 RepID=UPI0025FF2CD1|nr:MULTISPECIES: endonuclease/exonuclease/phosphatase family protein [unclassified Pseudomonas]